MKTIFQIQSFVFAGLLAIASGCSSSTSGVGGTTTGNPLIADNSASGAVAGAVGGALSGSSPDSVPTQSQSISKSVLDFSKTSSDVSVTASVCPTALTAEGSGCTASGSNLWLTDNSCKYPNSSVTFTGVQAYFLSAGTATCGAFPTPGANGTLTRQYVTAASSTTPSTLLLQGAGGGLLGVDNHTANLSNFDSATLPVILNAGYGASVSFDSNGRRSQIRFGHRVVTAGDFDQTVYGTLSVSETGHAALTRSVSGSVTVYHNGLQVVGNSTLANVVHSNTCCLPISGSITTVFSAGTNVSPTTLGQKAVGKSEVLTFTGCGTGTLQSYDGTTQNVALNRCF